MHRNWLLWTELFLTRPKCCFTWPLNNFNQSILQTFHQYQLMTNIYQLKNGHPISRLRIINCNSETVIYISLNNFFIVILPILVILYIYVCMHVGVHFYIFLASIVCSTFVQYWLYSYIYLTFWPVNMNVTLTSSVQGQDLLPLRTWCAIPRPASVDSIIHLWPVMSILHL